ncbi:finger with KRAB and SCAN domains 1-like isoform X2 [Podarcis lilfordi]|uniref:Finger with KRAB and SCAN domains 1-like isoform X2 n=1 Tax=Podarcis lilfordi TaxID=74358 RepID=A0AA35NXY8_9SAUR|nr:finger with KRAB and SCAN domains 1-like isoform X2 [Podarcis lilfordi]
MAKDSVVQSSICRDKGEANGTTLPIHPCSLLPPEGLEMAEAGLTEGLASAKEKEGPFGKEEASLTQPGQRTMFWQVKEENCRIVGSLGKE